MELIFNHQNAKIAVALALAHYFSSQPHDRMRSILWYLPALLIIAVPFSLVLIQPDLGTALMFLFGGLVVVFAAGLTEIRVGCVRCGDSGNTHIMDATSCLSKGARNDFFKS